MTAGTEMLTDWPERREEALGMTGRFEVAQHPCGVPAFPLACRLVGVLGPIVQPAMSAMLNVRHDLLLGRFVAAEFVGDQHPWGY